MNVDDDRKEPVSDLGLLLDYSNRSTTQLIENSGAGANAASTVNMAFVASDHLTELVWSPRKGLSIKCTNCSTAAGESRGVLAMGSKATSANQTGQVKAVTAVTSSKSSGRNVRVGSTCQSAYKPVNEGSRCNSSPCPKDMSELHASPVKLLPKVSGRKRSFHTINKAKGSCLQEKTEQHRLCMASNIDGVYQHSTLIPEENQKAIAVKKHELSADDGVSVFKDKSYRDEDSPTESKINEYHWKGKAKVLSDAKVQLAEDESRGSIESCSSAGSFCSQQKKRSLGQKFTSQSKRIRTTIQQNPRPMSLVNESSSFVSWISNMTKGINKANKYGTPCLALTLPPSGPQNENCEWKIAPHGNNEKYPCQGTGFQNIFQSMYCMSSKVHNRPANTDEHHKNGEPFDACIGNSMVDVVPLTVHEMTSSSCKGAQSSGNGERQMKLPKVLCRTGYNRERTSAEKGASFIFLTKAKSIKLSTSRSSLDTCGTHNNDSSLPPKINAGLTNVSDPFQSFWITRFCPKSPVTKSVTDNHGQIVLVDSQTKNSKNIIFRSSKVCKVVQGKGELKEDLNKLAGGQADEAASDSDASVGLKDNANFNAQTSDCSIDKKFSSERIKRSEAMASLFATRLDAIKHMTPAGISVSGSGTGTTCFYCGKKGHILRSCLEFTENKFESLLDSIGFPDNSEKTPCLCIRCFQLGHWATDCPSTQAMICGPLAIPNNEFPDTPGDRSDKALLAENKDIPMSDIPFTHCNQNIPKPDSELYELNSKSGPVKHELEESRAASLPNSFGGQSLDILKGYFDAVRLLRLSRREILKLMNSQMEVSNLEGFFLRLRLGNMEKRQGGIGYHVAYIEGIQSEESCQGSKFILPVNMGSIKILVGSQSISNQEFLEDELMAWWCNTVKNGKKLPTREELNEKLLQRNKLQL